MYNNFCKKYPIIFYLITRYYSSIIIRKNKNKNLKY